MRWKSFLAIVFVALFLFSIFATPALAWPPGGHDAIAKEAFEKLQSNGVPISEYHFRSRAVLNDIAHVLYYPPFCICDAVDIIHHIGFGRTMFQIAKNQNDTDKKAWAAGWVCHRDCSDHIWATDYYDACGISQQFGLKQAFFYLTNEYEIKFNLSHQILREWIWYPDLIIEAYQDWNGQYVLTKEKIDLATKIWIASVTFWYNSLPSCLVYPFGAFPMWTCTKNNWLPYFNKCVDSTVENVTDLYNNFPLKNNVKSDDITLRKFF